MLVRLSFCFFSFFPIIEPSSLLVSLPAEEMSSVVGEGDARDA